MYNIWLKKCEQKMVVMRTQIFELCSATTSERVVSSAHQPPIYDMLCRVMQLKSGGHRAPKLESDGWM